MRIGGNEPRINFHVARMPHSKSSGTISPLGYTARKKAWRHDATHSGHRRRLRRSDGVHAKLAGGAAASWHDNDGRTIRRAGVARLAASTHAAARDRRLLW